MSPEKTIAIRRPNHAGLLAILSSFNGLFSTSANRSGQKAATCFDELDAELVDEVALLVFNKDEQQKTTTQPSTILDITQAHNNIIYVLLEGTYTAQQLEGLYEFSFKKPS